MEVLFKLIGLITAAGGSVWLAIDVSTSGNWIALVDPIAAILCGIFLYGIGELFKIISAIEANTRKQ